MNKKILQKIKLIDNLEMVLPMQVKDFADKLFQNIDYWNGKEFFYSEGVLKSASFTFKGNVDYKGFTIKKKQEFFSQYYSTAVAKGEFQQKDDKLYINAAINGISKIVIFIFIILILLLVLKFIFKPTHEIPNRSTPIAFLCSTVIPALIIAYLFMRYSVKKLKHDLEREFYFIIRN